MSINKLRKKLQLFPKVITVERKVSLNVWQIDLSDDINNIELKKKIIHFKNAHPESNVSNVKAWHSSYLTHHITTEFDTFISSIESIVNRILTSGDMDYYFYNIDNFWIAIYEKNTYTKPHGHNYDYVFVYYVEADENTSPLIIESNLVIKPKPGLLVLFSGTAIHHVPKLENDSSRTILSGNIARVSVGYEKVKINKDKLVVMLDQEKQFGQFLNR